MTLAVGVRYIPCQDAEKLSPAGKSGLQAKSVVGSWMEVAEK